MTPHSKEDSGPLIWSAAIQTQGTNLAPGTRGLSVSLKIKALIAITPKDGNLGEIPGMVTTSNAVSVSKNLSTSPHLISPSTWVAYGCLKRSRADLECMLTQPTY